MNVLLLLYSNNVTTNLSTWLADSSRSNISVKEPFTLSIAVSDEVKEALADSDTKRVQRLLGWNNGAAQAEQSVIPSADGLPLLKANASILPLPVEASKDVSQIAPMRESLAGLVVSSGSRATGVWRKSISPILSKLENGPDGKDVAARFAVDEGVAKLFDQLSTIYLAEPESLFERIRLPFGSIWIEVSPFRKPWSTEPRYGYLIQQSGDGITIFFADEISFENAKGRKIAKSLGAHIANNRTAFSRGITASVSSGKDFEIKTGPHTHRFIETHLTDTLTSTMRINAKLICTLLLLISNPHVETNIWDYQNRPDRLTAEPVPIRLRLPANVQAALAANDKLLVRKLLGWNEQPIRNATLAAEEQHVLPIDQASGQEQLVSLILSDIDNSALPEFLLSPDTAIQISSAEPPSDERDHFLPQPEVTNDVVEQTGEKEQLPEELAVFEEDGYEIEQTVQLPTVINSVIAPDSEDQFAKAAEPAPRPLSAFSELSEDEQIEVELRRMAAFEQATVNLLADAQMYLCQAQSRDLNRFECIIGLSNQEFPINLVFSGEPGDGQTKADSVKYTLKSHVSAYRPRGIPLTLGDAVDLKIIVQSLIYNAEGIQPPHVPMTSSQRVIELDTQMPLPILDYSIIVRSGMYTLILEALSPYTKEIIKPSIPLGIAALPQDGEAEQRDLEERIEYVLDYLTEVNNRRTPRRLSCLRHQARCVDETPVISGDKPQGMGHFRAHALARFRESYHRPY